MVNEAVSASAPLASLSTITLFGLEPIPEAALRGRQPPWGALEVLETELDQQPVLRPGSTGGPVSDLQRRLTAAGFSPGLADGDFGPATERAVRAFQSARALFVDGIVGPRTWEALGIAPIPSAPIPPAIRPHAPGPGGDVTLENNLAAMRRKGYVIHEQPYKLYIVGVRTLARPNTFDDTINVFYKDTAGNWVLTQNPATTEPGVYHLKQPMNVKGTAIVAPGQYLKSHQIGLHRGEYTALVQRGPIAVVRDADKDDRIDLDTGTPETGLFGINIHRSKSSGTGATVDKFSAGCQVFASSTDFARFIEQCQRHKQLYGNSSTTRSSIRATSDLN